MGSTPTFGLPRCLAVKFALNDSIFRVSGWCLGAAALLVGCAAPVPVKLDSSVPAHWHQSLSATSKASTDLSRWWLVWNDTQLNALVDEALAQNLDVAQAVLRLRQQRLLSDTSRTSFLPTFSAGARTLQDIAATDSYFHASVDVSWDLGLFGASDAAKRASTAGVMDAQAQLHAARVALVADVVHKYLDIRLAQRQQALYTQLNALNNRSLHLLQVRRAQHLGNSQAIQQQKLLANTSAAQLGQVQEAQARAAHGLAALLGRTEAAPEWLQANSNASLPAGQSMSISAVPADMLRTRPDIQSAEATVERAAAELGVSRAALYPRFTLTGSILYSYNLTQNYRTTSDNMPLLGPQIDIPLFDWGRRRAQADANELALQASIKAYRQSVLNGIADVESSLAAISIQQTRLQGFKTAESILSESQKAQAVRLKLGLSSEFSGLDNQRIALQTQSDAATAQAAQALAYVSLYKALGGAPLDAAAIETAEQTAAPAAVVGQQP